MGKKTSFNDNPFPNLMSDWLEDGLTLEISKLTGCDETEYPVLNSNESIRKSILGMPDISEVNQLSSSIDSAISAFIQKHGTRTINSLDELLEQSAQNSNYEFEPKSFESLDLDFLK